MFPIVLDHEHGVSEIAKPFQRRQQLLVVPVMEADRRLVEDVENAGELRADLGGEANALGFPAGEGPRSAIEGEIAEPDVEQELQPRVDLGEDRLGDLPLARGQGNRGDGVDRTHHRKPRELVDSVSPHAHRGRLRLQPAPPARLAHPLAHEAADLGSNPLR